MFAEIGIKRQIRPHHRGDQDIDEGEIAAEEVADGKIAHTHPPKEGEQQQREGVDVPQDTQIQPQTVPQRVAQIVKKLGREGRIGGELGVKPVPVKAHRRKKEKLELENRENKGGDTFHGYFLNVIIHRCYPRNLFSGRYNGKNEVRVNADAPFR